MVAFNPDNPTQVQPYINWARPTQEPRPDISGEIRGKAVEGALQSGAAAIREGAQGITAAYEKGIQNTIYAGVDPLRDDYMAQLHGMDQIVQGRNAPDPLGRDAPRDVKQLPRTLETFDSARASGKLSQTDYDARLTSLAKEIRAKYPGFRQYVDEEFKRITGRDSANQYIRSVIQDIDSFIAGRQAKRDAFDSFLMREAMNFTGGAGVVEAYQKNPEAQKSFAMHWLNANMAADRITKEHNANIDALEKTEKLNTDIEEKAFKQSASASSGYAWSGALHAMVMAADLNNPKWTKDLQEWERTGIPPRDMSSEEGVAIGQLLTAHGESFAVARTKQLRDMVTPEAQGPPQSTGAAPVAPLSRITDDMIQKQVKSEKELYWDHFQNAMVKNDLPLAMRSIDMVKANENDVHQSLVDKKDLGRVLSTMAEIRKIDPNLYSGIISTYPGIQQYLIPLVSKSMIDATTPPAEGGVPMSEIQARAIAKNVKDGNFHRAFPELIAKIGKTGKEAISDEATEALIENVFGDPNGPRFLQAYIDDSYLQKQAGYGIFSASGKVLGRQYVFDQMFSEGIVKKVAKLAKDKPELYDHLESAAESNNRVMMPREYTLAPPPEATATRPEITYNDQSHKFSIKPSADVGYMDRATKAQFNRVSDNLNRLAVIAEHNPKGGGDPTVRILDHLVHYQEAQAGSMIFDMIKAIVTTKQAQPQ